MKLPGVGLWGGGLSSGPSNCSQRQMEAYCMYYSIIMGVIHYRHLSPFLFCLIIIVWIMKSPINRQKQRNSVDYTLDIAFGDLDLADVLELLA